MDGTPGSQAYGQMNNHLINSANGYPTDHDSTSSYMERTMSLNSGNYKLN